MFMTVKQAAENGTCLTAVSGYSVLKEGLPVHFRKAVAGKSPWIP